MKKLVALIGTLGILALWFFAWVHPTVEAGGPATATYSARIMWGTSLPNGSSNSSLTLWSWPQTKQIDVIETRTNLTSFHQSWKASPASTPFIIMPSNDPRTEAVYLNEVNNGSSYFWSHWNNACTQGPELIWQVEKMNGIDKVTVIVHNRANATMFASFDSGVTWSSIEPNSILDGHSSARVGKVYFDWVPNDNPKPVEVCAYAFWNLDSFKFQEVETQTPTATATPTATTTSSPTSSPVPPTSTPLATRYDFRLYDNQITLGNQTTAQWVRFSYSGNRVVYSATIPSGLSLVGVAGCETGQGCEYKGYFADSSPVEIGQQARTEWAEAILKPTKAGTYSLTGHFQEPATGAFAFRTITLQVVDIANPTASPTSSPTATATATATKTATPSTPTSTPGPNQTQFSFGSFGVKPNPTAGDQIGFGWSVNTTTGNKVVMTTTFPSGIVLPGTLGGCATGNGCIYLNDFSQGQPGVQAFYLYGSAQTPGIYTAVTEFYEPATRLYVVKTTTITIGTVSLVNATVADTVLVPVVAIQKGW